MNILCTTGRFGGRVLGLLGALLLAPAALPAQQSLTLEGLKTRCDERRGQIDAEAVAAYSNVLALVGEQLKRSGDVDGYVLLKAEQTFLVRQQALPAGEDRTNLVDKLPALDPPLRRIEADRNARLGNLLRQYIAALEPQVKQLMLADKIDDAKLAKDRMDAAKAELAGMETARPAPEGNPSAVPGAGREGDVAASRGAVSNILSRGLFLYYCFDKDEGRRVTDASGNGHDGKVRGAAWIPDGKVGGAYEFRGSDFIEMGYQPAGKELTLMAWIKPANKTPLEKVFLSKGFRFLVSGFRRRIPKFSLTSYVATCYMAIAYNQ